MEIDGIKVGLTICEDIWVPGAPLLEEALAGAEIIVNLSASPYDRGNGTGRERMLVQRARDNLCAIAFCALVGGQDELVFDGQSCVIDHTGHVLVANVDPHAARAARLRDTRQRPAAREAAGQVDQCGSFTTGKGCTAKQVEGEVAEMLDPEAEVYAALVLGTRDYVFKNGFE